jgi:hypothetical protein
MRRYYVIIILILGTFQVQAQVSRTVEEIRDKVLPQYNSYFIEVGVTEKGLLDLTATEKYIKLSSSQKKAIMNQMIAEWRETLVVVHCGNSRELWNWKNNFFGAQLVDLWNLDVKKLVIPERTYNHIFFSLGGQAMFSKGDRQYSSLYLRMGYFLLLNIWDLAASYQLMSIPISDTKNSNSSSFSLMSRVHFPIKKIGLSPNVGFELNLGEKGSRQFAFNFGASWMIRYGSIDLGFRLGEDTDFTTLFGFTISPKFKFKKKS